MDLDELTELNRIVIIDDDKKDGASIRDALATKFIPSLFIHLNNKTQGALKLFPNVKLVFLDLGMLPNTTSERAQARYVLQTLQKIVGEKSFYILVVWSTHIEESLARNFMQLINEKESIHWRPIIDPIQLSKKDCKSEGEFCFDKINKSIHKHLLKIPNFRLLMKWDAMIEKSKSKFIDKIFANDEQDVISQKLHALAKAYAGKRYKDEIAKNALLALSEAVKGSLNAEIISKKYVSMMTVLDVRVRP